MSVSGTKSLRTERFERQPLEFDGIDTPKKVGRLEIAFCNVETLNGISRLENLQELFISYCRSLSDISENGRLRQLKWITLFCLPNVEVDFRPDKLVRLVHLSFNNVCKLTSIGGIERLKQLTHLGLSRVKVLDGDYTPIVQSKSLKRVFWFGSPFKTPALKEIRRLRPDIVVGGNSHNRP